MEKALIQRQSNCLKVVLFGPESTGKTTLARSLAAHFKTTWAPEYMRTYLEEKWRVSQLKISKKDLIPIAQGQINTENKAAALANKVVFCDTNLLEIQTYCEYYYHGFCPSVIKKAAATHTYHLYLLTGIDVPWEQDNLRDRPDDRLKMFCNFESQLKRYNLPYFTLRGSKKDRLSTAIAHVNELLK